MIRLSGCLLCGLLLATISAAEPVVDGPSELALAKRAMGQEPADWTQALRHLLLAKQAAVPGETLERDIAVCLQNSGHPLPAMAWYQVVLHRRPADDPQALFAIKQLRLLDVDLIARLRAIYTQAAAIAEKQATEQVALNGVRMMVTDHRDLPRSAAAVGLLEEALATDARFSDLHLTRANYSRMITATSEFSLRELFAYSTGVAGDLASVDRALAGARGGELEEEPRTGVTQLRQCRWIAELACFRWRADTALAERRALEWAEADPAANLDAICAATLRRGDATVVPELQSLLAKVGSAWLSVHAVPERNGPATLSEEARRYLGKVLGRAFGPVGVGPIDIEVDCLGLFLRCASLAGITHRDETGQDWPVVAWVLHVGDGGQLEALRQAGLGADAPTADDTGVSNEIPLHQAVLAVNPDAVALLLALGADPRRRDRHGKSAFDLARELPVSDRQQRVLAQLPSP